MHRVLAAIMACTVLLAGCDGDPTDPETTDPLFPSTEPDSGTPTASPSETPSDDPSPTPTDTGSAAAIDVTTTPDVITEEWAEAVINTLLAEYGEIASEVLDFPVVGDPSDLPPELYERTRELFDGQYEERRVAELERFAADEGLVRSELLPAAAYGGPRLDVQLVQIVQPTCLVVVGRIDNSLIARDAPPNEYLSAFSLAPRQEGDHEQLTPWTILDALANVSATGVNPDEVMLEATLETYGANLENTCEA